MTSHGKRSHETKLEVKIERDGSGKKNCMATILLASRLGLIFFPHEYTGKSVCFKKSLQGCRESSVVESTVCSSGEPRVLAPTWWFTTLCHSNPRVSNIFWPPWVQGKHAHGAETGM